MRPTTQLTIVFTSGTQRTWEIVDGTLAGAMLLFELISGTVMGWNVAEISNFRAVGEVKIGAVS